MIDQYTVSPKLAHSGVERELRLRPAALQALAQNAKSVFKFVIQDSADVLDVAAIARDYAIGADRIYLMPLGTTPEELGGRRPAIAGACLERGYRFSDRLHIHLYGNRPGV